VSRFQNDEPTTLLETGRDSKACLILTNTHERRESESSCVSISTSSPFIVRRFWEGFKRSSRLYPHLMSSPSLSHWRLHRASSYQTSSSSLASHLARHSPPHLVNRYSIQCTTAACARVTLVDTYGAVERCVRRDEGTATGAYRWLGARVVVLDLLQRRSHYPQVSLQLSTTSWAS
jgi:hypothetical protein